MTIKFSGKLSGLQEAINASGSMSGLARRIGVSPQVVRMWVLAGYPSVRKAFHIAAICNIAVERLLVPACVQSKYSDFGANHSLPVREG